MAGVLLEGSAMAGFDSRSVELTWDERREIAAASPALWFRGRLRGGEDASFEGSEA
jgi:hypothetical protein